MSDKSDSPESRIINVILWLLSLTERDEPYYEEQIQIGDHEAVRPFFRAALKERLPLYGIALIVPISILIITDQLYESLQTLGLVLDLMGAFILGIGLLRSEVGIERDSILRTKAATGTWGRIDHQGTNSNQIRDPLSVSSEAQDTVDALAGLSFITIGFGLQLVASII